MSDDGQPQDDHVTLLIVGNDGRQLSKAAQFLSRRGWPTAYVPAIKQAIEFVVKNRPTFVIVSMSHKNPNIIKLPNLLAQTFNSRCIAFGETSDPKTVKRLNTCKLEHVFYGAMSGPSFHMRIKKILMEEDERKKKHEAIDEEIGNMLEGFSGSKGEPDSRKNSSDQDDASAGPARNSLSSQGNQSKSSSVGGGYNPLSSHSGQEGGVGNAGKSAYKPSNSNQGSNSGSSVSPSSNSPMNSNSMTSGGQSQNPTSDNSGANQVGSYNPQDQNASLGSPGNSNSSANSNGQSTPGSASGQHGSSSGSGSFGNQGAAQGVAGNANNTSSRPNSSSSFDQSDSDQSGKGDGLSGSGNSSAHGAVNEGSSAQENLQGQNLEEAATAPEGGNSSDEDGFLGTNGTVSNEEGPQVGKKDSASSGEDTQSAAKPGSNADTSAALKNNEEEQDRENSAGEYKVHSDDDSSLAGSSAKALDGEGATSESSNEEENEKKGVQTQFNQFEPVEADIEELAKMFEISFDDVCESDEETSDYIEEISSIGVITVKTRSREGYVFLAKPEYSDISLDFLSDIRKTIEEQLKENTLQLSMEYEFNTSVTITQFKEWSQHSAKFCISHSHRGAEVCIAFFEVDEHPVFDSAEDYKNMSTVSLERVVPDVVANYTGYLNLKKNDKLVLYIKDGRSISEAQKQRLISKNVNQLYIPNSDINEFHASIARSFIEEKIRAFHDEAGISSQDVLNSKNKSNAA